MNEENSPRALVSEAVYRRLKEKFGPEDISGFFDPDQVSFDDPKKKPVGDCYILINPEALVRVCTHLRDDPELCFDNLVCLGGIDETGDAPALAIAYVLHSFRYRHRVILKARVAKDKPHLPSVQGVWSGANWFERETYDLFGIVFEGHPDLRRILLPPDWSGYPLRKDYEYPKEYNGISCVRPKLK